MVGVVASKYKALGYVYLRGANRQVIKVTFKYRNTYFEIYGTSYGTYYDTIFWTSKRFCGGFYAAEDLKINRLQ